MISERAYLLQHLLLEAAERFEHRAAIEHGGDRLTYGEVARRAQAIAAFLQAEGVRPGALVGVCLPKSLELVPTWFGVLLAGGAYVPLDASSPPARLRAILEDGRIETAIFDAERDDLSEAVPGACMRVIRLTDAGDGRPTLAGAKGLPRPVALGDHQPAYVYFTSGSTGRPKGAVISHRASLSYIRTAQALLRLTPEDIVANHAPLAFDLASFDVMIAMSSGAMLSHIPEMVTIMPGSMLRYFDQVEPTVLYTVPTSLNRLAALPSIRKLRVPSLRHLLFAGEPPNTVALRTLRPSFPNATFHHWYGSTEAALVTAWPTPPEAAIPDVLPIGRAVDNVSLALLADEALAPLDSGSEGELLVAATLLLDGYCHAPELTEAAFHEARSTAGLPLRWFRTRDVVRVGPEGVLFYVGRVDRMVKHSGFRVDLGEVENTLQRYPGLHEAAVASAPDPKLGARIEAFVVGEALEEPALAAWLRAQLPAHMLPDAVHAVPSLPRKPTGKVDFGALAKRIAPPIAEPRSA